MKQILYKIEHYLAHAPEGGLKLQKRNGRTYYYHQYKNWMKAYQKNGIWIYGVACLYIEILLENRYTIKELLQEIYINNNIDIIKSGLVESVKLGESKA